MQHFDIPIATNSDDKLNFANFASKIAQGVLNYSQEETFILAIEGAWGSGKTSLMNLIKNDIEAKVEILHFNPWLITDINQLIKVFFDELIKTISHISFDAKMQEEIKQDLIKFVSFITPETVNVNFPIVKFKYKPKDMFSKKKKENLESIKNKINKYLTKLDKKIVVIVDDIDRLTDVETEFIFRLTKGIADFNNLIYILLYDKSVVAKSLEKFKADTGQKYLEKIVQYSLNVPKPHSSTIKKLLFEQLDNILEKELINKALFQEERWHKVVLVLDNYIKNVRDINQIIGIISFEYPMICEDTNFVDFFIISLIKLKNYKLYEIIKEQPQNFFVNPKGLLITKEAEFERIYNNFNENLKEFHLFKNLLNIAFPAITKSSHIFSEYISDDHINKYICDIYYFENYFAFSMSDDKLTMKEYYRIEEKILIENDEHLKIDMYSLVISNKIHIFLDMFEQYKVKSLNNKQEIELCFNNILKASLYLKPMENDSYTTNISISNRCLHISFDIIEKHPSLGDYMLNSILDNVEFDLRTKMYLVEKFFDDMEISNNIKAIPDDMLIAIKNNIKNKLEAITLQDLIEKKKLFYVINDFQFFEASLNQLSNELKTYIFESLNNFFTILKNFIEVHNISSSNKGQYKKYLISKENLSKLIELSEIENYIKNLDTTISLSEENKQLLSYWNDKNRW